MTMSTTHEKHAKEAKGEHGGLLEKLTPVIAGLVASTHGASSPEAASLREAIEEEEKAEENAASRK
jgi:hypothetical protein